MATLEYVIVFVDDVAQAVRFYRDVVGFGLKFESPEWSELSTGATTLALHKASVDKPAGTIQLGVKVPDVDAYQEQLRPHAVSYTSAPREQHGQRLAEFRSPWGDHISVASPTKHS